jgi:type IV pilus assembly protein PilY1
MKLTSLLTISLATIVSALSGTAFSQSSPAQKPLFLTASAPPAVLLTLGRDHKLYYEAYNDAGDLDGDGLVDVGYKPAKIDYYGLFDSFKCYAYNGGVFEPQAFTSNKKCASQWSGDFLNYLTTTRIDAVRRVLYGGMRAGAGLNGDTTTQTILERAYIPQDAHSFGKQYESVAVSGYDISEYTPLGQPNAGSRHYFASVTAMSANQSATETNPPLLRYLLNMPYRFPTAAGGTVDTTNGIWTWLSKERPVAGTTVTGNVDSNLTNITTFTVNPIDLIVRVKVCVTGLLEQECRGYPQGAPTVYKPTGLLHEFGDEGQMRFGLLTGSYQNNTAGGVIRSNMANFADEYDANTGQFLGSVEGIVYTIDRLRVANFGNGNFYYSCGWNVQDPTTSGQNCPDWGNPIGEMMYEGLRYFAGKTAPTGDYAYNNGGSVDATLGLRQPAWIDPYKSATNSNGLPYCSKPVQLVLSDVYASFDSDQLPGSAFGGFAGDLAGLSVSSIANGISAKEGISGQYFIGQSGGVYDKIPSAKTVNGFGDIRGLAPDEPTRAGSYYSAAVAHYGKTTDLRTGLADNGWAQVVDTYSVALASPLPKIQIPAGLNGKQIVTLVPFGKSVAGAGITTAYQPTNQIVDFYVYKIVNQPGFPTDPAVNGGRPSGAFRINFEDVEQGADHDMDAIVLYTYNVNAAGNVEVFLQSEYAAGGIVQHMGYIASGTTADGTYLEVRDRDSCNTSPWVDNVAGCNTPDVTYALDTPLNPPAGYVGLPIKMRGVRTFTPGATSAKFIPHDPLWYAAKHGGFPDRLDPTTKKVIAVGVGSVPEPGWDSQVAGEPDNYFLVTNAAKLRDQLRRAFASIQSKLGSGTGVSTSSATYGSNGKAFQATYSSADWTGELSASGTDKNARLTALWTTSDSVSFPANISQRKVFTWDTVGKKAVEFSTTSGVVIPSTSYPAFNIASLYPTLAKDVTLNWSTLSSTQRQNVGITQLVNYVRGDRSRETSNNGPFRTRGKLLGDMVNSNVVYASGTDQGFSRIANGGSSYQAWVKTKSTNASYQTAYVGANDGMLHAFDANSGVERFAYVPAGVLGKLHKYAVPGYQHEYYVDGRLAISDAYNSGWTTVIVGSTGAGGRSVFALDVGNPSGSTGNILWEFNSPDLGYPIGSPVIGRTAESGLGGGRWVAIFANGYFSNNKKATVFVLDLFSGSLLKQIDLETASNANGLGSVGLRRADGITISAIFAGDLLGNFWMVDASSPTPGSWSVANSGALFKARDSSGTVQPITAQPSVSSLPSGGAQVFFGTGKLIVDADRLSTQQQSVYGIWLKSLPGKTLTRSDLIQQNIDVETTTFRTVTDKQGSGSEWGWFLDFNTLIGGQPSGERILAPLQTAFGYVNFNTWSPGNDDPCSPGGVSWTQTLATDLGGVTDAAQFDVNGDGLYNNADKIGGRFAAGRSIAATVSAPNLGLTPSDGAAANSNTTLLSASAAAASGGNCPAGSIASTTNGVVACTPQVAGGCPFCSQVVTNTATGSLGLTRECRALASCAPSSWVQLQ